MTSAALNVVSGSASDGDCDNSSSRVVNDVPHQLSNYRSKQRAAFYSLQQKSKITNADSVSAATTTQGTPETRCSPSTNLITDSGNYRTPRGHITATANSTAAANRAAGTAGISVGDTSAAAQEQRDYLLAKQLQAELEREDEAITTNGSNYHNGSNGMDGVGGTVNGTDSNKFVNNSNNASVDINDVRAPYPNFSEKLIGSSSSSLEDIQHQSTSDALSQSATAKTNTKHGRSVSGRGVRPQAVSVSSQNGSTLMSTSTVTAQSSSSTQGSTTSTSSKGVVGAQSALSNGSGSGTLLSSSHLSSNDLPTSTSAVVSYAHHRNIGNRGTNDLATDTTTTNYSATVGNSHQSYIPSSAVASGNRAIAGVSSGLPYSPPTSLAQPRRAVQPHATGTTAGTHQRVDRAFQQPSMRHTAQFDRGTVSNRLPTSMTTSPLAPQDTANASVNRRYVHYRSTMATAPVAPRSLDNAGSGAVPLLTPSHLVEGGRWDNSMSNNNGTAQDALRRPRADSNGGPTSSTAAGDWYVHRGRTTEDRLRQFAMQQGYQATDYSVGASTPVAGTPSTCLTRTDACANIRVPTRDNYYSSDSFTVGNTVHDEVPSTNPVFQNDAVSDSVSSTAATVGDGEFVGDTTSYDEDAELAAALQRSMVDR